MRYIKMEYDDENRVVSPLVSLKSYYRTFQQMKNEKESILVPNILERQGVTMLYGMWGTHKTYLTTFLSFLWANQIEFPPFTSTGKLKIAILSCELPYRLHVERFEAARNALKVRHKNIFVCRKHFWLEPFERPKVYCDTFDVKTNNVHKDSFPLEWWSAVIEPGGYDVVIIDSLRKFITSPLNVLPVLNDLSNVAAEMNIAILVVHHAKESDYRGHVNRKDNVAGGNVLDRMTHVIECRGWNKGGQQGVRLFFPKPQNAKEVAPLSLIHNNDGTFSVQDYQPKIKTQPAKKAGKIHTVKEFAKEGKARGLTKDRCRDYIIEKIGDVQKTMMSKALCQIYGS